MAAVDICGIGSHRIEYPDAKNQEFDSNPEFYDKMARKMIRYFGPKHRDGLAAEMLKNEDAVANVATHIMMGDWRWNEGYRSEEGKVLSHASYRMKCADWAIRRYLSRQKKANSVDKAMSLSNSVESWHGNSLSLADIIEDEKQVEPLEQLINEEERQDSRGVVDDLIERAGLTSNEEIAIRLYLMQDYTQVEVGNILEVTRQRAEQLIKHATAKLRKAGL